MDVGCEQIRDALAAGRELEGSAVRAHVAACEACAALLEAGPVVASWLAGTPGAPAPALRPFPKGWRESLRQLPTPVRWAAVLLVLGVLIGLHLTVLLRSDFDTYPTVRMVFTVSGFLLLTLLLAWMVLRPIQRPRLDRRLLIGVVLVGVVCAIGSGLMPAAHHDHAGHPESFAAEGDGFWPAAIQCLVYGGIVGLVIFVVLMLLDRGGAVTPLVLGGLALGALVGMIALQLHCPIVDPTHRLVAHAGVPFLFVASATAFLVARKRARPGRS